MTWSIQEANAFDMMGVSFRGDFGAKLLFPGRGWGK